MILVITALFLLFNAQIFSTQAMELTSASSEEENSAFKNNLSVLARTNHILTMRNQIPTSLFYLKNLSLSERGITDVPLDIDRIRRSIEIYLSLKQPQHNVHLDYENYEKLKDNEDIDIRTLNLSHNHIEYLPAHIGSLTILRSLNLAHNELTTIHENITKLTNLVTLNLTENDNLSISADLGAKLLALPKLDTASKDGIRKYIKESQI